MQSVSAQDCRGAECGGALGPGRAQSDPDHRRQVEEDDSNRFCRYIANLAGFVRTIDPFQAPTEEALAKAEEESRSGKPCVALHSALLQDVNRIYRQFSSFVKGNRPNLNIEADVCCGGGGGRRALSGRLLR